MRNLRAWRQGATGAAGMHNMDKSSAVQMHHVRLQRHGISRPATVSTERLGWQTLQSAGDQGDPQSARRQGMGLMVPRSTGADAASAPSASPSQICTLLLPTEGLLYTRTWCSGLGKHADCGVGGGHSAAGLPTLAPSP